VEFFELGNLPLSTGFTIPNARLAFTTHGTLNKARDNAILFPNFLGGTPEALEMWIGQGRPLDPDRYFIILPGLFGAGQSSSPSNTAPPFEMAAFPPMNIADDVVAQHRLVTEHLGIEELHLVFGWSVGALQTYEWAVRFPHMVQRMASIAGAPMPSAWTRLWARTVFVEPLMADPGWNGGSYTDPQAVRGGLRRAAHAMAVTLPPHEMYREELWRSCGFASVDDFVRGVFESFTLPQDPNNLISQALKTVAANPAGAGDLNDALRRITAKVFIYAFSGDPMFPPEECRVDAERIPQARYRELSSVGGHLATFALFDQDRQAVDDALREVLAS
jgi:homoserine O-acetyltransferase